MLSYWIGYYEGSYSPLAYRDVLMPFVGIIASILIAMVWFLSLIWKKHRLWTTGMIIGFIVLIGLERLAPYPRDMIAYGLRDRLTHDQSLDELRRFARELEKMPPSGNNKSFTKEDLANTDLRKTYPFLSWSEGASAQETDGVAEVRWGGFIGHWGFNVAINGAKLDLPSSPNSKALRISNDIFVISEAD